MNTPVTGLDMVKSNTKTQTQLHSNVLKVIAAVAVLVVLMLGVTVWMQPVADVAAISTAQSAPQSVDSSPSFEYFPAQYQNQGKEIPEHIEAF